MEKGDEDKLLKLTRWLIMLISGLVIFAMVVLALVAVAMPFFWDEAVVEIAREYPKLDTGQLLPRLYIVFALGLITLGLVGAIMRKLLFIVDSVALGDPFVVANAVRLRAIGWLMVAIQLVGMPLAFWAGKTADLLGENNVDFDLSLNGILSILLIFILARIFERGAEMREELEGTV